MNTDKNSSILSDTLIRPLRDNEIPALNLALRDSFSNYFIPMDLDIERLLLMFHLYDIKVELSVVSEEEGRITGAVLVGRRGDVARIGPMGVIGARQKMGLGKSLMEFSLSSLKEKGIKRVILEVITENHPAIKLYEGCGFSRIRTLYSYKLTRNKMEEMAGKLYPYQRAVEVEASELLKIMRKGTQESISIKRQPLATTVPSPKAGEDIDSISVMEFHYKAVPHDLPWQRNIETLQKLKNQLDAFAIMEQDKIACFLLKYDKNILLMGLGPQWKSESGLGFEPDLHVGRCLETPDSNLYEAPDFRKIVCQFISLIRAAIGIYPQVYYNNVIENEIFFTLAKKLGIETFLRQYEMAIDFC